MSAEPLCLCGHREGVHITEEKRSKNGGACWACVPNGQNCNGFLVDPRETKD